MGIDKELKLIMVDPNSEEGKQLNKKYRLLRNQGYKKGEYTIIEGDLSVNFFLLIDGIPGVKLKIALDNINELCLYYETAHEYRNQGYGSEAVRKVCEKVLSMPCVPALHIYSNTVNSFSLRIARKNGFKYIDAPSSKYDHWVRKNTKHADLYKKR